MYVYQFTFHCDDAKYDWFMLINVRVECALIKSFSSWHIYIFVSITEPSKLQIWTF